MKHHSRKTRVLYRLLALFALATFPASATASKDGNKAATRALESALRAKVKSPGGHLRISIRPSPRAAQGYFEEVKISARPAQIKKFRFASLDLTARHVRLDARRLLHAQEIVTLHSTTQLRAVASEADLTRALAQGRSTAAMGLRVKFLRDRIQVSGRWNWSWFRGPVSGVGKLRVTPRHELYFDLNSLQLNGRGVPAALRNRFSQQLNPLLDYRDLPFNPRFRSMQMNGSRATITAY